MTRAIRCEHRRLIPGSGGYYVFCADCWQSWVARSRSGKVDTDLDREGTSQTRLHGTNGYWEWKERQ